VVHPVDEVDVEDPDVPEEGRGAGSGATEHVGRGVVRPEVGLGLDDAHRPGGAGPETDENLSDQAAGGLRGRAREQLPEPGALAGPGRRVEAAHVTAV
jgi:hypothetical protein